MYECIMGLRLNFFCGCLLVDEMGMKVWLDCFGEFYFEGLRFVYVLDCFICF